MHDLHPRFVVANAICVGGTVRVAGPNQWHRACIIAAVRTFNLDDVGTVIAEQYCAIRIGQMIRKVHNANSTHRSGDLTDAPSGQKSSILYTGNSFIRSVF